MTGRIVAWVVIAGIVGVLTHRPSFEPLPAGHGELTLSLAHLTERLEPCRRRTPGELAALPPNMRAIEVCERPRAPAVVELTLGERRLLVTTVRPAGLHRDGRAYLVRSWAVPAGRYPLRLRLRDTPRSDGFDLERSLVVDLPANAAIVLNVGDGDVRLLNTMRDDR